MFNEIKDSTSGEIIDKKNYLEKKFQNTTSIQPVSLNNFSKQLEAIKNSLKDFSEINEARILYFKSEIALGNYQIDCDLIARKMLDLEPA